MIIYNTLTFLHQKHEHFRINFPLYKQPMTFTMYMLDLSQGLVESNWRWSSCKMAFSRHWCHLLESILLCLHFFWYIVTSIEHLCHLELLSIHCGYTSEKNIINDNHCGMKKATVWPFSEMPPFLTKRYKWAVEYCYCIFMHKRYGILCFSPS